MTDWELLENNRTYVWLLKNETHLEISRKKKRSGAVRKSGIVRPCRVCHLPSLHPYREVSNVSTLHGRKYRCNLFHSDNKEIFPFY